MIIEHRMLLICIFLSRDTTKYFLAKENANTNIIINVIALLNAAPGIPYKYVRIILVINSTIAVNIKTSNITFVFAIAVKLEISKTVNP